MTEPSRYRLLVIDDDPATVRDLRVWLQERPYDFIDAPDGREGFRRAAEDAPDLILLDVTMPGEDGFSVATRLKSDPRTDTIPILFLSARREVGDKKAGLDAGGDDYITKPFEVEEVEARVLANLRKRGMYLDMKRQKETLEVQRAQLEELSRVDDKTGLANFRWFQQRLKEEWLRAERYGNALSVVMLDLDDFKKLNDRLGHPAGDVVLREFATLVAGGARATDLPARYGGEEFAVLLPHTDAEMALRVAERIRGAVASFVFLEDTSPTRLTVSAGIATWPGKRGIASADALLAAADEALYRAKRGGKNVTVAAGG